MTSIGKIGGVNQSSKYIEFKDKFKSFPITQTTQLINLQKKTFVNQVPQPFIIAQSKRRPGIGEGAVNDITFADMTENEIKDIGLMFKTTLFNPNPILLFADLKFMAGLCFTPAFGAMRGVVFDMINFFEKNSGNVIQYYKNSTLNKFVQQHNSTRAFIQHIRSELQGRLQLNKNPLEIRNRSLNLGFKRPIFHEGSLWNPLNPGDLQGGLTFAINDTWAYDLSLLSFINNGSTYTATIKITLYDHFGLDIPDVKMGKDQKNYGFLAGFRSWFVLQHWNQMGYKPFITTMEFEETFTDKFEK